MLGAPFFVLVMTFIYVVYAWLYYHPRIAQTPVVWIGVVLALIGNILWVYLARSVREPAAIMLWSLVLGLISDATAVVVPVAAFGLRPSPLAWVGIVIALVGLGIIKYAGGR
jgi:hypothetical protein